MTNHEKQSWYILALAVVSCIAVGVIWIFAGSDVAFAGFGIFGLAGLSPILFKTKDAHKVLTDERDVEIHRKSTITGYSIFWVFFIGINMGLWYFNLDNGVVSVDLLPRIAIGGMIILFTVKSIATIILYRVS